MLTPTPFNLPAETAWSDPWLPADSVQPIPCLECQALTPSIFTISPLRHFVPTRSSIPYPELGTVHDLRQARVRARCSASSLDERF
ncbi:hypothetical protein JHW43_007567 [Diplocarpon mali]|nr:hypothetical protein JHW43_007567 [Diplocarpon mali]